MKTIHKILSYIIDYPLEKVDSQFSGKVEVSIHRGEYKLSTKNVIYSFGKNYTSFETALEAIEAQKQNIPSVLVIGFGLGSVVDLLESNKSIQQITAVDADAVILDLAKKYSKAKLKNKVTYCCSDAMDFVKNESQQYHLILFDVFIDDETPIDFMQEDFLNALKNLAAKEAYLLFSKINDSQKNRIENMPFEKKFSAVFPNSFSIDANGNKLFAWQNK